MNQALFAVFPLITLIIVGLSLWLRFRATSQPRITGPALTGTAQVLSVARTGWRMGIDRRVECLIGLRVQVPGRRPYDVTVREDFLPWTMGVIQPGRTVAVQVDSANPQNVRIDISQPIRRPPQPGSSSSPRQSIAQRLQELETLRATGTISDAEYTAKREQIINQI